MKGEKAPDLATLWRQIVQDYEEIRREQEEMWASLSPEERIRLAEDLILLIQEAERVEDIEEMLKALEDPSRPFEEYLAEQGYLDSSLD